MELCLKHKIPYVTIDTPYISRFPLPLHPPKLSEVQALIGSAAED